MTDAKTDELMGRAKEAAGALTDDQDLKNEGKADKASGKAKGVIDDVAEKLKEQTERAKGVLHRHRDD